jgi:endonuclease YncB( thermonuclease family)
MSDPQHPESSPRHLAPQVQPLSIQAASLIRAIDALSTMFWISIGGTILTVLFAGLNQLPGNVASDSIYIGEYQIPKSILPVASLGFAAFVFWLTSNHLKMLDQVLNDSHMPFDTVQEIFTLNPPVLNIFHPDNHRPFKLGTGSSILLISWSVFFGNSIAFTLASAVQRGASLSDFELPQLITFGVLTIAIITYGVRAIDAPLDRILERLHGSTFEFGWARVLLAIALIVGVAAVNNLDQFRNPSDQPNGLLGPAMANAIDGETLFINGIEVQLIGIDAMEPDQTCLDKNGTDYPCGRAATRHLEELVADRPIVCLPLFAVSKSRIVASCNLLPEGAVPPNNADEYLAADRHNSLSGRMVRDGHALIVGIGKNYILQEERDAQRNRVGIWSGSFEPPWMYRARRDRE